MSDDKPQFQEAQNSSLLKLLVAGNTEKLTQELSKNNQLSPEAKQFLPQLLNLFVEGKSASDTYSRFKQCALSS